MPAMHATRQPVDECLVAAAQRRATGCTVHALAGVLCVYPWADADHRQQIETTLRRFVATGELNTRSQDNG